MPQASIFAFAPSCGLDPDGSCFVTRMRPLNGNLNAAVVIAIDVTNVASMVLTAAFLIFDRERDRLSDASM
jgi:hypothetical protein